MRDFRFGFNTFAVPSRQEFVDQCRRAEAYGFDIVLSTDHLGAPAPFSTLVAAAETTALRVGTMVLNTGFWNPHLLAREVATADRLTDGRLELGLGAGHMKWEFDEAGIPWAGFGERVDRLERLVGELGGLFARPAYEQGRPVREAYGLPVLEPVQRQGFGGYGPPLLIGGTGDRVLRLAARQADIVGVAGAVQVKGAAPGVFRLATSAQAEERVAFVRAHAGERAASLEFNVLIQAVVITEDRRAAAEAMVADQASYLTAEEALESPFILLGTVREIAEQLRERRERYGFSYITVHGPYMEAFGPVIEHLR